MPRSKPFIALVLLSLILSACSAWTPSLAVVTSIHRTDDQSALNAKLAPGLLTMEGTDLAVTADQAATLLPFWQAYQNLSQSSSSSQAEIQALYRQIEDTLTSEQIASIQQAEFTPDILAALKQKYDVQENQAVGTKVQSSTTPNTAPQSMPVEMGGGMAASDMGGGIAADGIPSGDMAPGSGSGKAVPSQNGAAVANTNSNTSAIDLNTLFTGAVLRVLIQRAQA